MNVILVFASVFLPVGWFIYQMLRYTTKSLGDESPLVVRVTYQVSKREYFTSFEFLFLIFYTLGVGILFYTTIFFMIPTAKLYWHWLISLSSLAVSLFSLGILVALFKLNLQYWLITRDRIVTLDPTNKSLEIRKGNRSLYITASSLEQIEHHTPGPSSGRLVRMYSYLLLKLKDGRSVHLNLNKSYLDYSLQEYFKSVPTRYIPHKIPWIIAP